MARPGKTIEASERSSIQLANEGLLAGRLGRLSLGRQVVTLAIWPFLEQILGFLVATVDLLLATRMAEGDSRIALMDALGLGGYLVWLMMILQGSVASGVLAIVSRASGARNQEEARKGLAQGLLTGLLTGTISGFIFRLSLPLIITIFALSPEAAVHAENYLNILCWTCPCMGVLFSANNALRGTGDTRTPFVVMLAVNLINAVFSFLFVFGPEPIGGQGIEGLAWGTLLAWGAGAVIILIILLLKNPDTDDSEGVTLSLRGQSWRPQRAMISRIAKVGLPQGVEMLGMWLIQAYTVNFITRLPIQGALGIHFIAIRVESLSFLPGFAIGAAGATLVGQYLGARNPTMALKALRTAWLYALIFMSSIGIFFLIAPEVMIRLILPETDAQATRLIELAVPLIFLCGVFQPALATSIVMKTCLRGAGATNTVMIWSFISLFVFRAVGVTIGTVYFNIGLTGIWVLMSIDLAVQAIIFTIIAHRKKWMEITV